MLIIKDMVHMEEVKKFAIANKNLVFLEEKLNYLNNYGCSEQEPERTRCTLSKDLADKNSFHVVMERKDKMTGLMNVVFIGSLYYDTNHAYFGGSQGDKYNHVWKLTTTSY